MSYLLAIVFVSVLQQPIDATALTFTIEKDAIIVRVGRWKLKTNKTADMNRFVDLHLKEIDPNKIVIYGDDAAKYKTFEPVIEVLKKHDWMKFKLESTSPKPKPAKPKIETNHG